MNVREKVEFVVATVDRRDFDALEREGMVHPDMEFHSIVSRAEGSFYRGIDGLRQWGAMADGTWSHFRIAVTGVRLGSDDRALVELHLTGTARSSGVPLDVRVAQVWEWRDGLLWRNTAYSALDDAARAAGL